MSARKSGFFSAMWMLRVLTLLAVVIAAASSPPAGRAGSVVITVNTTEDAPPGVPNGNCTLREALLAADTNAVVDACDGTVTDNIGFNIGVSGSSQTITLATSLAINSQIVLDGTTQPGYAGTPLIHVTSASAGVLGFDTGSDGSIVRGLQISQTGVTTGLTIYLGGDNYQVTACYINTDGTATAGSSFAGIWVDGSNNTIGGPLTADRNLFGGNGGVYVNSGSGNTIQGNYFGVQTTGNTALTGSYGSAGAILINPGSPPSNSNTIRGNVIGGFNFGIALSSPSESNTVAGNYIGVGANGSTPIGNSAGVYIQGSSNNTIGGTTAADRNVISASTGNAHIVLTQGPGPADPAGNTIEGNYIGTSGDGMTDLTSSTSTSGIRVEFGSNNVIGGTAAGAGNLISGSYHGIMVLSGVTGTIIRGNRIGTDATGATAMPNLYGITGTAATLNIGDSVTPGNNIIAGNSNWGIALTSSGNTIYGNRIGVGATSLPLGNADGVNLVAASATLGANWIGFNRYDGIRMDATSTVGAGSTTNCITGNGDYGVQNFNDSHEAPFTGNWWGSDTGPTHSANPGGTGDAVTNHVTYSSFLTLPAAACHIFADIPTAGKEWMEPWVDAFYIQGITTGCGANPLTYCPENPVTRAAMAVFILRAIEGSDYTPPAAHHYFSDMPVAGKEWMEPWVDEFYDRGITTGCGIEPLRYCPENPVTRAAMAVFILRAVEGSSYIPAETHHYFSDLPVAGKEWMEPFVDEFYDRAITTGCGTAPLIYCPENSVIRAAMAVFISRAYNIYP